MFRVGSVDRARAEGGERPEDTVRRLLRLKKAVARARGILNGEVISLDPSSLAQRAGDAATEMALWEGELEEVRMELAELIAECDRWRIAHDKLRERLDRHTLEPRSEPDRRVQSSRQPVVRARPPEESQDFTAIDKELERLNASMMAAFSQQE